VGKACWGRSWSAFTGGAPVAVQRERFSPSSRGVFGLRAKGIIASRPGYNRTAGAPRYAPCSLRYSLLNARDGDGLADVISNVIVVVPLGNTTDVPICSP